MYDKPKNQKGMISDLLIIPGYDKEKILKNLKNQSFRNIWTLQDIVD